jgi:hypothetical protein
MGDSLNILSQQCGKVMADCSTMSSFPSSVSMASSINRQMELLQAHHCYLSLPTSSWKALRRWP